MAEDTTNESQVDIRQSEEHEISDQKSAPKDRETTGPFDVKEVPAMRPYVDLGGIKVAPREGLQLRLDVDSNAKRVVAISLDLEGSTLQVQAFSAPKNSGLWNEVRAQVVDQVTTQGTELTEQDGPFGPEVLTAIRMSEERGGGIAPVRLIGVDGPRWLLRGAITGAAVVDSTAARTIEDLFRQLVVVRGDMPMPPNELLSLKVPAGAQTKSE